MTTNPQLDEWGALQRTFLIIGIPLLLVVGDIALLIWLSDLLDPWWFQTDACPQDPNLYCGQPAPVLFLIAGPLVLLAAGIGVVGRWRKTLDDRGQLDGTGHWLFVLLVIATTVAIWLFF